MRLLPNPAVILIAIFLPLCRTWWWRRTTCPEPDLLHPCICFKNLSVITCEDLYSEDVLKTVAKVSRGHGILGIQLQSAALRFIPEDTFEGLDIKVLSFKNSSIRALSETAKGFSGLEDSLNSLIVEGCTFVNSWEWSHMANLTKLEVLSISDSELLEIDSNFLILSKLPIKILQFTETSIQTIPKDAFHSFKELNKISLDKNELAEISRSMFPRPAKKLVTLGLTHNRIQFLPEDMFLEMPVLKFLYLGGNPFYIIDEKTFKPVWKQLSTFDFHNVQLTCDCRLSWITKMKKMKGKLIHASCYNPTGLRGRNITTLEAEELKCSMHSRQNYTNNVTPT